MILCNLRTEEARPLLPAHLQTLLELYQHLPCTYLGFSTDRLFFVHLRLVWQLKAVKIAVLLSSLRYSKQLCASSLPQLPYLYFRFWSKCLKMLWETLNLSFNRKIQWFILPALMHTQISRSLSQQFIDLPFLSRISRDRCWKYTFWMRFNLFCSIWILLL